MNFMKKMIHNIGNRVPISSHLSVGHNFLTIDTRGRIIIEDCDKIISFTDMLLIVGQGKMTLTFVGEGLKLNNLARHSAELSGRVDSIRLDEGVN